MVEARSVWSESSPRHEERGTEVRKHQSISGGTDWPYQAYSWQSLITRFSHLELLVQDVRRQSGALPLQQHALLELSNKRVGRGLTVKAYQKFGKLEGALQRRADALEALSDKVRELCRRISLRLTLLYGVQSRIASAVVRSSWRRVAIRCRNISDVLDLRDA
jgi:hypothetical protein